MQHKTMLNFNVNKVKTPCYVVDEDKLKENLTVLRQVSEASGCRILLAQKAFSMFSVYGEMSEYLSGTTASGLYEAKLAHEYFRGENHIFSPAYNERDFDEIMRICDHVIFNSVSQLKRFADYKTPSVSFGLRLNPEYSTQNHPIYDPCSPGSRLGITEKNLLDGIKKYPEIFGEDIISGYHMHTLCEQDSEPLERTFSAAEKKFGKFFEHARWINLGGGHHITREGYDIDRLVKLIIYIRKKYGCEVYLEPGEAAALNAGYLVSTVEDVFENGKDIAVLDASAACHMPDVLEMPYRPEIIGAGLPDEKPYTCRLGGPTCLAGDIIGDYSFERPLCAGDRIVFCDMAIYSMVKNNTFNGTPLPAIYLSSSSFPEPRLIKEFSYSDFRSRLS